MGKLIAGATMLLISMMVYLGITITAATILANLGSGINPESVLREAWNYFTAHYIAAMIVCIIGLIFFIWGFIEDFRQNRNRL